MYQVRVTSRGGFYLDTEETAGSRKTTQLVGIGNLPHYARSTKQSDISLARLGLDPYLFLPALWERGGFRHFAFVAGASADRDVEHGWSTPAPLRIQLHQVVYLARHLG